MKNKFVLLLVSCVMAFAPFALAANDDAKRLVKERRNLMETQKDAMKVIGAMAKGEAPFNSAKAGAAAAEIETTAKDIVDLFPEGSVTPRSEAKPEIWTQWDKFTSDAEGLETAAAALRTALAEDSPEWKAKFKGVIDSCKACHKTFRAEKKK